MSDRLLDQFLTACGAERPLQLDVALGGGRVERRSLPQPFAVVGRLSDCDLCIAHPQISRRHVYLQVIGSRLFCIDLGSRTGIRWGDGTERAGWLDGGHDLRVGPALIRLGEGTWEMSRTTTDRAVGDLSLLAAQNPEHDPLPAVSLEFRRQSGEESLYPFDRILVLAGRAPECRLRLRDPQVSKLHCTLLRTPGGLWVVDLLGRGGIRVNGARVRYARLDDGDELHLGRRRIRVRYGARDGSPRALAGPEISRAVAVADAPWPPASSALDRLLADRPPDQVELVGSLLGPILGEFRALQEQMVEMQQKRSDEFQDALMTMFRMFGVMHRDQMNLIREEMDQIHRLTQEQRGLESKLAGPNPALPEPANPVGQGLRSEPRPGPHVPIPIHDRPAAAPEPGATGPAGAPHLPSSINARVQASSPGSRTADADVHAWLNERILNLREERRGRWQKLLRSLLGQVSGEPLP